MQILNASAAWLSNYEVQQHLLAQKERREQIAASCKHPPRTSGNILTVEFETLQYLKASDCALLSDEKVAKLMEYFQQFSLTKAEKLQLLNNLPRSPVDFYLIVEECDERFQAVQIEDIIENVARIVELPTEPQEAATYEVEATLQNEETEPLNGNEIQMV